MNEEQQAQISKIIAWLAVLCLIATIIFLLRVIISPTETYVWLGVDKIVDEEGKIIVHAKTLWDLLELLLIPAVLALIAYLFKQSDKRSDLRRSEEKAKLEHALQTERLEAASLDGYIKDLSDLLLDKGLQTSTTGDVVRNMARVRTSYILRQVNGRRKGFVVRALCEANLIDVSDAKVSLAGADLRNVELAHAGLVKSLFARANAQNGIFERAILNNCNFNRANLAGANLKSAQLRGTKLERANLREANLSKAYFENASLIKANFVGANLAHTVFRNSNLKGADCSEACLLGTDWSSCELEGINLKQAQYDSSTKWPAQFDFTKTGATSVDNCS